MWQPVKIAWLDNKSFHVNCRKMQGGVNIVQSGYFLNVGLLEEMSKRVEELENRLRY